VAPTAPGAAHGGSCPAWQGPPGSLPPTRPGAHSHPAPPLTRCSLPSPPLPRLQSASGFDKTGPYRAQFILDSIADLRAALRAQGSELVVRVGRPEEVLPALVREVQAGAVYCHGEVTYEECQVCV
jgi:hypothetical protein